MFSICEIEKRMASIRERKDSRVCPGQAVSFNRAHTAGDAIRQGDLYLVLLDEVPDGYVYAGKRANVQLVPGNTEGARHCLDSLQGVKQWTPEQEAGGGASADFQLGPVLRLAEERVVLHPTHGHVTLLENTIVQCLYQREHDAILKAARRAAD
jgi:hypothetical protein